MTTTRIKGTCPICLRSISLLDDRSLFAHNRRKTRKGQMPEPCPGSGQQPLDQSRLGVGVACIATEGVTP